jgi:hypothetical protein
MQERFLIERLRESFVGSTQTFINDDGVEYEAIQITRSPSKGIIVAIKNDKKPGGFSLGWSFLSPKEPTIKLVSEEKVFKTSKGDLPKKINIKINNIDWKAAKELALKRAREEEPNPAVPSQFVIAIKRFYSRAFSYFNPLRFNIF